MTIQLGLVWLSGFHFATIVDVPLAHVDQMREIQLLGYYNYQELLRKVIVDSNYETKRYL